jgi:pyruvate formate lyase activating enzyme
MSLVDYPGRIAAVLFFTGCNFRCPFCHNPELVLGAESARTLEWAQVQQQLEKRTGFLDAVVVSGGEPTLHGRLPAVFRRLRALGLRTKLDTNGSHPDRVRALLDEGAVDFVAIDIKAPWRRYRELAGVEVDTDAVRRTVEFVDASGLEYELRTTVAPTLTENDILEIASAIAGAKRYVLQRFVPRPDGGLLDPSWSSRVALDGATLHRLWEEIQAGFADGGVRGATGSDG